MTAGIARAKDSLGKSQADEPKLPGTAKELERTRASSGWVSSSQQGND